MCWRGCRIDSAPRAASADSTKVSHKRRSRTYSGAARARLPRVHRRTRGTEEGDRTVSDDELAKSLEQSIDLRLPEIVAVGRHRGPPCSNGAPSDSPTAFVRGWPCRSPRRRGIRRLPDRKRERSFRHSARSLHRAMACRVPRRRHRRSNRSRSTPHARDRSGVSRRVIREAPSTGREPLRSRTETRSKTFAEKS